MKYQNATMTVVKDGIMIYDGPYSQELELELIDQYQDQNDKRKNNGASNPCFDCKHEVFFNCPKAMNSLKKGIGEYPFIDTGYQIKVYNPDTKQEEVVKFAINKCNHFVLEDTKPVKMSPDKKWDIINANAEVRGIKTDLYKNNVVKVPKPKRKVKLPPHLDKK